MVKLLIPDGDGVLVLEWARGSLLTVVVAEGLASPKNTVLWGRMEATGTCKPHFHLSGRGTGAITSRPTNGKTKFSKSISLAKHMGYTHPNFLSKHEPWCCSIWTVSRKFWIIRLSCSANDRLRPGAHGSPSSLKLSATA